MIERRGNRVTFEEWRILLVVALIVTGLLQVPYALGYAFAQPGTEFTGLLINVEDGSYLSAMGQGIEGAWLYHLPFTTEEHAPAFIQVFYLALGHLARALSLSAVAMWHTARVIADVILFLTVYGFIAFFLDSPALRRVAYWLAIFGAGYDLFRLPFDAPEIWEAVPIELRMPEAHIVYSALTYPHFAISIALVLITFWLILRALTAADLSSNPLPGKGRGNGSLRASQERGRGRGRWLFAFGAGVGNLLLGIVYPFLIYLMITVSGAYYLFLGWRARRILRREAAMLFIAFAIPAPLFLYYQLALTTNPALQTWNAQATTISPNPLHFVLAYITLLPFALLTFRVIARLEETRQRGLAFLWVWVGAVAVLLYTPVSQQRRFVEGVQVPLAILAALGLYQVVLPWLARTRVFIVLSRRPNYSIAGLRQLVVVGIIALASLTSFYIWISSVALLGFIQPYPLFRPKMELDAMDWLRVNTARSESVLSSYWTGSLIHARAGNPVFVGQRYETIRFDDKRRASEKFFDAVTDNAWRVNLLREYRLAYVFWGRGERDLGNFDPERVDYLQRVFSNDVARIYRVRVQ